METLQIKQFSVQELTTKSDEEGWRKILYMTENPFLVYPEELEKISSKQPNQKACQGRLGM